MQFFTIHLPTKAYLKKYIQSVYGNPVILTSSNVFTDVFLAMMLVPLPVHRTRVQLDQQLNRLTSFVDVKVPMEKFYRVPKQPGQHSTLSINRYFENKFEEDLYSSVRQLQQLHNFEKQEALEIFAREHDIELDVDISFDGLKKKEYRFRTEKEKNNKLFLVDLSRANLMLRKPR